MKEADFIFIQCNKGCNIASVEGLLRHTLHNPYHYVSVNYENRGFMFVRTIDALNHKPFKLLKRKIGEWAAANHDSGTVYVD